MSDNNGPHAIYPPHDLAPELDELDIAYAHLQAEAAELRAQLTQANNATEDERAARRVAEADNAALIAVSRDWETMNAASFARHYGEYDNIWSAVRAQFHPGRALLTELDAARAVVTAAGMLDGNGTTDAAWNRLWDTMDAYGKTTEARGE